MKTSARTIALLMGLLMSLAYELYSDDRPKGECVLPNSKPTDPKEKS